MTRTSAVRLRSSLRRLVRELAFDAAVERDPATRRELERKHARAIDDLLFAEGLVAAAIEREAVSA